MRTMLVPVDGSRNSVRALKHALAQSRHGPMAVHVLNVEPPLDDYGMVRAYITPRQHNKAMHERAVRILRRATRDAGRTRARVQVHVAIGDPAPVIVRTARRLKCDAIVMGTRGMSVLGALVLGSVAGKVVHLSRVPVTLVK